MVSCFFRELQHQDSHCPCRTAHMYHVCDRPLPAYTVFNFMSLSCKAHLMRSPNQGGKPQHPKAKLQGRLEVRPTLAAASTYNPFGRIFAREMTRMRLSTSLSMLRATPGYWIFIATRRPLCSVAVCTCARAALLCGKPFGCLLDVNAHSELACQSHTNGHLSHHVVEILSLAADLTDDAPNP